MTKPKKPEDGVKPTDSEKVELTNEDLDNVDGGRDFGGHYDNYDENDQLIIKPTYGL